jgi:hypothetical protein
MSSLPEQTFPVYASDEDIAVKAGGDFVTLCPSWQQMASGTDGFFTAGSPWVLNSTLTNFETNGVAPNQVVCLSQPKSQYPGGGQLLAIDSVSGTTITLRRLYKELNVGQPPAPAAGLTNVTFVINTLDPQSSEASFDIKRRFGIDERIVARNSTWIYDLRDLRLVTVLEVLLDRYSQERRTDKGDFALKVASLKAQYGAVLDRVQVRWGPFGNSEEPTTLFSCKLSR